MKKLPLIFLFIFHVLFICNLTAQSTYDSTAFNYNCFLNNDSVEGLPVRNVAPILPEFSGGMEKLYSFLSENIKLPSVDSTNELQFKITISFVVDTTGNCINFCVINRKYPDRLSILETECLRVLALMPPWVPGQADGRKVPVIFILPIHIDYE